MNEPSNSLNINNDCNCNCNLHAYFPNGRIFTAESFNAIDNNYTFNYMITNPKPSLNNILFSIQCPTNIFTASSLNTSIAVIGNPNVSPIIYTPCTTVPCPTNSYKISFEFEEKNCCFSQAIKIELNSSDIINEIRFIITFTVPSNIYLCYESGILKIQAGQEIGIASYLCMPGCKTKCNEKKSICEIWNMEKEILIAKKDDFIHYSQNLFPDSLSLNALTFDELEIRVRQFEKLEKSIGKLNCNIAKVLKELNKNYDNFC